MYPAGWLENARRLCHWAKDIELLFFEASGPSDLPKAEELWGLLRLKEQQDLSYTVHTPLNVQLASPDVAVRRASAESILRVARHCEPLAPLAVIVHVYLGTRENDPNPPADLDAWRTWAHAGLSELCAAGLSPECICVESLDYDLGLLDDVIEDLGLGVALDLGHVQRECRDLHRLVERFLPRARVIHWHGCDPQERDHRSLEHFPLNEARWLLRTLRESNFDGVLTLEVFRPDDWEASVALVSRLLQESA